MTAALRYFLGFGCLAAALFAALGLGWVPAGFVEAVHVVYILPFFRAALGGISAGIPFSLAQCILLVGAVLGLAACVELSLLLVRRLRGKTQPERPLRRTSAAIAFAAAFAWLYLIGHGLSLARAPMSQRLGLEIPSGESRSAAYDEVALATARAARRERAAWQQSGGAVPSYEEVGRLAREAIVAALPLFEPVHDITLPPGSIKGCVPEGLLMRFSVSGVFSPLTFEAHVDPGLPPTTLPFVAAHELAHLAGIAGEDEANFVAWLACSRSRDAFVRYSAHLVALNYFRTSTALRAAYGPEVGADRSANAKIWRARRSRRLSKIQIKVWDSVLKGQGIRSGIRSYREMVELMLAWHAQHSELGAKPKAAKVQVEGEADGEPAQKESPPKREKMGEAPPGTTEDRR